MTRPPQAFFHSEYNTCQVLSRKVEVVKIISYLQKYYINLYETFTHYRRDNYKLSSTLESRLKPTTQVKAPDRVYTFLQAIYGTHMAIRN